MKPLKSVLHTIILVSSALLIAACSSSVDLKFAADQTINPDTNGQSLPVLVKVYQLRDESAFNEASFDSLWKMPSQALGNSLVAQTGVTMVPNTKKTVTLKLNDDTEHLGFVAIYRTHQSSQWKIIKGIPGFWGMGRSYNIKLHGNTISVD